MLLGVGIKARLVQLPEQCKERVAPALRLDLGVAGRGSIGRVPLADDSDLILLGLLGLRNHFLNHVIREEPFRQPMMRHCGHRGLYVRFPQCADGRIVGKYHKAVKSFQRQQRDEHDQQGLQPATGFFLSFVGLARAAPVARIILVRHEKRLLSSSPFGLRHNITKPLTCKQGNTPNFSVPMRRIPSQFRRALTPIRCGRRRRVSLSSVSGFLRKPPLVLVVG